MKLLILFSIVFIVSNRLVFKILNSIVYVLTNECSLLLNKAHNRLLAYTYVYLKHTSVFTYTVELETNTILPIPNSTYI